MNASKRQLIETSLFLFIKNGYNGVSLTDILRESKLSKGSFYYYFASKEKCFEECVMYFLAKTKAESVHCDASSLHDFIKFNTQNVLNTVERFGSLDRISFINDAIKIIPSFVEQFTKSHFGELEIWVNLVTQAIEAEEIRNILPAEEIAKLFVYQSDGLVLHLGLRKKTEDLRNEIKNAWKSIYNLLKA